MQINLIFEFSRQHCIAICAVLVPLNLLFTSQTLFLTLQERSPRLAVSLGCTSAVIMILHVYSWLAIGVVMPPTYILLGLGSFCLVTNLWIVTHSQRLQAFQRWIFGYFKIGTSNNSGSLAIGRD